MMYIEQSAILQDIFRKEGTLCDGSLVVGQDTDSDYYSLTRVARDRARPGAGISEI
jgi:hypothetical protein